jgi:hypothetical protein
VLWAELILPVWVVTQVVLIVSPGLPERPGLGDPGDDRGGPHAGGVGVGERLLGDLALIVARIEDLGTVVGTDDRLAKVRPVDLEEELEDVAVGGLLGIEDDLNRLRVARMVAGGRVVVLPARVAGAGRDDSVAAAQQFLRGPETSPGQDLAVLVSAARRARLLGGFLRLAAVSPQVGQVLNITGLDRHFANFPSVQAASTSARGAQYSKTAATGRTARIATT